MRKALIVRISGRVQGVGFRPFIHRLAISCSLSGYVRNLGGGEVEIYIEGSENNIRRFLEGIEKKRPPPARIDRLDIAEVAPEGVRGFKIVRSSREIALKSDIPPDLAVCNECLEEILDPSNRRFRYPFNSCAYCGPRYSYIEKLPYDRENITMRDFPMCDDCLEEYRDLHDRRRYEAKGISCPRCGPSLWLVDSEGRRLDWARDPIREAARLIEEGNILAVKGLGGFHIACLATDDDVVAELRRRKMRPYKPFAIMALDVEVAERIVEVSERAKRILKSPEAPILILPRREGSEVSELVAPGLSSLGVMLAYTPLHYLLLLETRDRYLIMTSGNPPGRPMCTSGEEALERLKGISDYFLLHNRRIVCRVDDSVLRFTAGQPTFLRRARGYAPESIKLPRSLPRVVLAFGAELQNVGGVGWGDRAILTQYVGDTDELETLDDLWSFIERICGLYRLKMDDSIIACDMHPGYQSVRLAKVKAEELGSPLSQVQHHVAHLSSAMADWMHDPEEPAVGICIDGAGYGLDGHIWGGEVITYYERGFRRVGHLEYVPLPGGDRSVLYPARMLASMMFSAGYGLEEVADEFRKRGIMRYLPMGELELEVTYKQWRSPQVKTSSCGRFLDSISALLGVCWHRSYEGEPAIKLEEYSRGGRPILKPRDLEEFRKEWTILSSDLLAYLLGRLDKSRGRDIAYTAQYAVGWLLGDMACEAARGVEAKVVYMSGGAAVNDIVATAARVRIEGEGLELRIPRRVPPGDGGVALGQIYALLLTD